MFIYGHMYVCVVEWVRSRAVWLHCTTSQTDLGSNAGAGAANQTVHPSGVGKLVAISIPWVTAVEGWEGEVCGCTMAGVRLMQPVAQTTASSFLLSARAS
jgi:hypothetical protein